jgi:hypothetical protein
MLITIAEKNDWVLIHRIILQPTERAENIPIDTKQTPLQMWVKGYLAAPEKASVGDTVSVTTRTGRTETGTLLEVNPTYRHNFGDFVPELLAVSEQLRAVTFEGNT